ncbi:MAG: NifU family protein [Candidatus Promineifilaceae bacterium]|nr:NifU family protein [Candidatus Promineifilaceae bacterium]
MTTLYAGAKPEVNGLSSEGNEEERMHALIEAISSYITHYHGGAVEMVNYDGNILQVKLLGACEGCDLAPVTLHGWVEGTVKQFFPHLERVESV